MRQQVSAGWSPRRARPTINVPGVRVRGGLLDRNFPASAPNRCWVADITYLRTWEGWLYLVAVQDPLQPPDRWLGDGRPHAHRTRHRRAGDGARASLARARARFTIPTRAANRIPRPSASRPGPPASPNRWESGRLLRQRRRRKLLRDPEEGIDPPPRLAHQGRAPQRGLRVHRGLLQPRTTPHTLGQRSPADYEKINRLSDNA